MADQLERIPPELTVPEIIEALHAWFCRKTERTEPVRFHHDRWYQLLTQPEYVIERGRYDARALALDVALVIRYLRLAIRDGKRNPGALKVANFTEPQQFFADLEEARTALKVRKRAPAVEAPQIKLLLGGETVTVLAPAPDPEPVPVSEEGLRQLAELRRKLRGGDA